MTLSRFRPAGGYAVGLCMLAYILSFVDRQMLALLVGPIRTDLHLSDTEFGLLLGLAFSVFYATLGLPIAALADRVSRPLIIAGGILLWSVATMTCAGAGSFAQLFLARVGVGAGEAALTPAAYSLFSDLYPKDKLGRALSIYSLGSFIGSGSAYLVGGAMISVLGHVASWRIVGHDLKPWQTLFLLVGAPGLLLGPLLLLVVRDPRTVRKRIAGSRPARQPRGAAFSFIRRHYRVYLPLIAGYSLATMCLSTLLAWSPSYLAREFGLGPREIGYRLGAIAIVAGGSGVMASGWLMDLLARRGYEDAPFRTGVIGMSGMILPSILLMRSGDLATAEILLAIVMFFASFPMPPAAAALQITAPPPLRAQVSAVFLFCNSLGGTTLGVFLVGFLNDHVFHTDHLTGVSMNIVVAAAALLGSLTLITGAKPFRQLVADARSTETAKMQFAAV